MGRIRARRGLNRAGFGGFGVLLHLLIGSPAVAQSTDAASHAFDSACERAGRLAERAHALPAGLLLAIGRIESGRWDAERARVVPWPWAVDGGGDGRLLDSKEAAIARTVALRNAGVHNIDVGCFQIDLASHPFAFAGLDQAFDPVTNADYAGRFLVDLHARLGSWTDAVAAYHSMTPERGIPYRQMVFADWSARDQPAGAPAGANGPSGPVVVEFASGARMRIWTPGSTDAASGGLSPTLGASAGLPHVLIGTPSPR